MPSTDASSLKPMPSWMKRSRSGKAKCGDASGTLKPSKSGSTRFLQRKHTCTSCTNATRLVHNVCKHSVELYIATRVSSTCKALSTLSQKSATVAENGETTVTVALFSDSRTFLRQCGQALNCILWPPGHLVWPSNNSVLEYLQ